MRAAMAEAEVGDDVYGEDPTVNALEAEVAALLGFEAGLFVPSGSLGNQLGLRLLVRARRGARLRLAGAHRPRRARRRRGVLRHHVPDLARPTAGRLDVDAIAELIAPDGRPVPGVDGGDRRGEHAQLRRRDGSAADAGGRRGRARPRARAARCTSTAPGCGTRTSPPACRCAELAAGFDTVSVCLSKGLGAPVGSVLGRRPPSASPRRGSGASGYGGGMRQVGILAAAGRYALAHNLSRLADDHAARATIWPAHSASTRPRWTATSSCSPCPDAPEVAGKARAAGVLVSALGPQLVRLVTHLDVDDDGIERAVEVLVPLVR